MRAAVLRNTGDEKLELRDDVGIADVGPGQVKVKIEATGVCHSDVSAMSGVIPSRRRSSRATRARASSPRSATA